MKGSCEVLHAALLQQQGLNRSEEAVCCHCAAGLTQQAGLRLIGVREAAQEDECIRGAHRLQVCVPAEVFHKVARCWQWRCAAKQCQTVMHEGNANHCCAERQHAEHSATCRLQLINAALDISALFAAREDTIARHTRFTSRAEPAAILKGIEAAAGRLGGASKRRGHNRRAHRVLPVSVVVAGILLWVRTCGKCTTGPRRLAYVNIADVIQLPACLSFSG